MFVASNKTAYNSYFKWKKYVNFENTSRKFPPFCEMCIYLHLEDYFGIKKSIKKDLGEKFWSVETQCNKNLNI